MKKNKIKGLAVSTIKTFSKTTVVHYGDKNIYNETSGTEQKAHNQIHTHTDT